MSIVQIMSDGGSQLQHHLLGDKKDFYQNKLGAMWGIFNNLPYSQHRNACERKVQSAKRLIKQALGGGAGTNWTHARLVMVYARNHIMHGSKCHE